MTLGFVVAERVLYAPSIGFCLLLGVVLDHFASEPVEKQTEADKKGKDGKAEETTLKGGLTQAGKIALGVAVVVIVLYGARCGICCAAMNAFVKCVQDVAPEQGLE